MKYTFLIILIFTFSSFRLSAQFISNQSISATGEEINTSNFLVSYAVGDIIYQDGQANGILVIQGFIQPTSEEILSIDQFELIDKISINPNPVENVLTVNLPELFENTRLRINSITGQQLGITPIEEVNTNLNVEFLKSGTYILLLETNTFTKTFKIIKK